MQSSWKYLFLLSLLHAAYGNFEKEDVSSISSGLSFGRCRGYCQQSVNATNNPVQLSAMKQPNFADLSFPPLRQTFPFSLTQWEELLALVPPKVFSRLGDTIGCPGCADGGIEWIQIDWKDGSKRVTFESERAIKGIEGLIEKLRKMREEYLPQF